jgi:hypothetical protein
MSKPAMSFRSSRITYYGPHPCDNCGVSIVKMGHDFGGNAFTNPSGHIYPNTEWHVHVCDPSDVHTTMGAAAKVVVQAKYGFAVATEHSLGWVIRYLSTDTPPVSYALSAPQTFSTTEAGAWLSARERLEKGGGPWVFVVPGDKPKIRPVPPDHPRLKSSHPYRSTRGLDF